jgi:creatinine amidohydrolase
MGFPGTLDLRPETLVTVLGDLLASLRAHGFQRAFLFSAHGGNAAILKDAQPELAKACDPMQVIAFIDLAALTETLHGVSAGLGVAPEAAGHHAGEFETSILSALRPQTVRRSALAAGTLFQGGDAQALFYPNLRANAPNGTVGDPRGAAAPRAQRYLEAWVELLTDYYRDSRDADQGTAVSSPA